jgi:hypothetical protein
LSAVCCQPFERPSSEPDVEGAFEQHVSLCGSHERTPVGVRYLATNLQRFVANCALAADARAFEAYRRAALAAAAQAGAPR